MACTMCLTRAAYGIVPAGACPGASTVSAGSNLARRRGFARAEVRSYDAAVQRNVTALVRSHRRAAASRSERKTVLAVPRERKKVSAVNRERNRVVALNRQTRKVAAAKTERNVGAAVNITNTNTRRRPQDQGTETCHPLK